MKKLLALSALALLLGGCGQKPVPVDNDLTPIMGGDTTTEEETGTVDPTEAPYSAGPSEIPSDLIPNE